MKQVYIPYTEWEDYINGMWRTLSKDEEITMLKKAIDFTGNWEEYGNAMKQVIKAWPKTMLNSMTNLSINRRAFLGHCACQFAFNCPEYVTRMAWKELTDEQRYRADKVAQQTIDNWVYEYKNKGVHKDLGEPMLF